MAAKISAVIDSNLDARSRYLLFACWIVFSSAVFFSPILALARMAVVNDDASHEPLVPLISAVILFIQRRRILRNPSLNLPLGSILFFGAVSVALATYMASSLSSDVRLSLYILALALIWIAGFTLLFGTYAAKASVFPLIFLFLMIPPPDFALNRAIYLLQLGSAWITGGLFDLFRVPALRDGFVFHLPGANIEIARECSGIRSSMALLILGLVVAHFRLSGLWRKTVFIAVGVFMMILKNGIRIAALTLLATYVDPSFLTGKLHRDGGAVFFALSLLLLWPVLLILERGQRDIGSRSVP